MSNIKLRKKGNGQINTFGIGRGNVSLNGKVLLRSYSRSFNFNKFEMYRYNDYINDVNSGVIYQELSGLIGPGNIVLFYETTIYYFKVGDEVLIDSYSLEGLNTFEETIENISYADFGYGVGPYNIIYDLNNHNNIKKYLKFYPSSNYGFVVECLNDKPITLVLGEFTFTYDTFNGVVVSDYDPRIAFGQVYWCLNFNDTKTVPLSESDRLYFLNNFMLPSYDGVATAYIDESIPFSSQFSMHRVEKLN